MTTISVTKIFKFDAAHFLPEHSGNVRIAWTYIQTRSDSCQKRRRLVADGRVQAWCLISAT
jgi:6-pyruvoyl-tetrahydropterin synthase